MKRFVLLFSLMALMAGLAVAACNNPPPVLQPASVLDTDQVMTLTNPVVVDDVVFVVSPALASLDFVVTPEVKASVVYIITPVITAISCTRLEVCFHPPNALMAGGTTLIPDDVQP